MSKSRSVGRARVGLRTTPYARIGRAARSGKGLRLSAEDVEKLYFLDEAIRTRADMDEDEVDEW